MKRLVDDPELSEAARPLVDLVRQADRFAPSLARKRRVLARMNEPRSSSFRFRAPALGVALLALGGATAAAAVGYRWVGVGSPPAAVVAPAVQSQPAPHGELPEAPARSLPSPAASSEVERAPGHSTTLPPPSQRRNHAVAAKLKAAGEDPAPVLEAIRALRKSEDPARAQKLLDAYLATNPRGALREDALGLAIEAAAARRDPRAAEYANRYLSLFPNGRFRAVARKAARPR